MNHIRQIVYFLLFLFLSVFIYSCQTGTDIVSTGNFTKIIVLSSETPVKTASENLFSFLKKQCPQTDVSIVSNADCKPNKGTIIIGTTDDNPLLKAWNEEGFLSINTSDKENDNYEIVERDGCIVINGTNSRAVLYGVFELEDILAANNGIPSGLKSIAKTSMKYRILHPLSPRKERAGFTKYEKFDFEYIARCGGNYAHLTLDWMKEKTLFSYIPSAEFPKAVDNEKINKNRKTLRKYLDWCNSYGLDAAIWLSEMPCQGGGWVSSPRRKAFLEKFPAECLSETGTNQGKVLCLGHHRVEQEYRRMVRQFVTDFPEISMIFVFTLDSSGEFCDPQSCPRHKGVSKLSQYNHLLALMTEEGRKVNPDFQVVFVGWSWLFRGDPEYFAQQEAFLDGTGITLPADGEAWAFDRKITDLMVRSREIAKQKQQTFLGYDIFLWSDDTWFDDKNRKSTPLPEGVVEIFDYPLGIAAKMRRWQKLDADGFFDQWGTKAEYIQLNAISLRELVFYPKNMASENIQKWAESLTERRFGKEATPYLLSAWEEIEQAQQIMSDYTYFWHIQRPMWSGSVLKTPLTLEALQSIDLSGKAEPSKPYGQHDYAPFRDEVDCAKALVDPLNQVADHFGKALSYLKQALPLLSHDSKYDHWYEAPVQAPLRFSPKQLLEEQIISVRLQEAVQRRMSHFFDAWSLVKTLPEEGSPAYKTELVRLKKIQEKDKNLISQE